ncbi:MAG TPA: hypothetical protein VNB64_04300 [Solirubrobacteraceae bacterium]|nr:hypothetical protein [Solirubrobacteraceae bacterium]
MSTLRFAVLAAVIVLAVPASASAARFAVAIQASQLTTWSQARQLDNTRCTWQEGRGREYVRFAGTGIANARGDATSATWTYGGLGGIPLRAVSSRFNLTMTEDDPAGGGTRCGAVAPRSRLATSCGTERGTVRGRLRWDDSLLSVGVVDRNDVLGFPNCPVWTSRGVPPAGLAEATQRVRNLLSSRDRRRTFEVRRTFRGTRRVAGRVIVATTVVRWSVRFYRFAADR